MSSTVNKTNYFAILLRQKANLVSLTEANRVAGAVPLALAGVMNDSQLNLILQLLPPDAIPSSANQKFYHRIDRRGGGAAEFNLAILLARLQAVLNLTGPDEAIQYIRAYFLAASALMNESDIARLFGLLPPQLVRVIHD